MFSRQVAAGVTALRSTALRPLAPGALTVSHVDQGSGLFAFVLSLRHPLLGEMIFQKGTFREASVREASQALSLH